MSNRVIKPAFRAVPALGRYFRVLVRHSLPGLAFVLLAMIAGIALSLLVIFGIYQLVYAGSPEANGASAAVVAMPMLICLLLGGATAPPLAAQAALSEQEGRRARFGEAWSTLWRHGPISLVIQLLQTLMVGLAMVFLVLPGVIVSVFTSLAIPARVGEGLNPFKALSRSVELTEGVRWRLFGYLAVTWLLVPVTFFGGLAAFGSLAEASNPSALADVWPMPAYIALNVGFALLLLSFFSLVAWLSALGPAVAFAEIRARGSARAVSDVFD